MLPFRTTWTGLLPVVLGVAWYSLCSLVPAVRNHNLQSLGVWLSLVGIVVLFFGYRPMRYLWFPLVFLLLFGQSTSDRAMTVITFKLQDIAAVGAEQVLWLMGLDVVREGNTLKIYDAQGNIHPLNIAEACSGMRMLMAFLALGVAMAYTGLRRFWQQCIVVIMAVPTAIFVNILRVVTLSLLSLVDAGLAADDFHSFIGILWLVPALFIYMGLIWIVKKVVSEPAPSPAPSGGDAKATAPRPAANEQEDRAAV
jgi:exosortase